MQILGIIMIVTGIVLALAGRNVSGYLPPDYQSGQDDDFLQLLKSTGKLIGGAGICFIVAGVICILIGVAG